MNPENKAALEAWVRETGIRLVQVNGQRKYGGPPPGTVAPAPVVLRQSWPLYGKAPKLENPNNLTYSILDVGICLASLKLFTSRMVRLFSASLVVFTV